jgi:hypothetical protein
MTSSDQCALGLDGALLDAEHIAWYNDPDDTVPLPAPAKPPGQALHVFFSGAAAPAVLVAGSRRSARVSHPSKRLVDPDNAERASSSKRPRTRKILVYDSEVEGDGDVVEDMEDVEELAVGSDDATGDTDVDLDDEAEEAYASTKAMSDADRKVCSPISFSIKICLTIVYSYVQRHCRSKQKPTAQLIFVPYSSTIVNISTRTRETLKTDTCVPYASM